MAFYERHYYGKTVYNEPELTYTEPFVITKKYVVIFGWPIRYWKRTELGDKP